MNTIKLLNAIEKRYQQISVDRASVFLYKKVTLCEKSRGKMKGFWVRAAIREPDLSKHLLITTKQNLYVFRTN